MTNTVYYSLHCKVHLKMSTKTYYTLRIVPVRKLSMYCLYNHRVFHYTTRTNIPYINSRVGQLHKRRGLATLWTQVGVLWFGQCAKTPARWHPASNRALALNYPTFYNSLFRIYFFIITYVFELINVLLLVLNFTVTSRFPQK